MYKPTENDINILPLSNGGNGEYYGTGTSEENTLYYNQEGNEWWIVSGSRGHDSESIEVFPESIKDIKTLIRLFKLK